MWVALLKRYWQVSILKETPANTPYSPFLLTLVALIFYVLILWQWAITDTDGSFKRINPWIAAAALLASYGLYTMALEYLFRVPSRAVQTLTSLFACHSIVHVFAFPLIIAAPWLSMLKDMDFLILVVGILYFLLTLLLTVWQFIVTIHIYKAALSINYIPAVLASFGLLASNILMVSIWR